MRSSITRPVPHRLAVSISLGLLWAAASAQASVTIDASATYAIDGGSITTLHQAGSSGAGPTSVDVLEFGGSGGSSYGIHTYGSVDGSFGSRSSGMGVYDVTGLFSITESVLNPTATAQHAIFNFYITPGLLQNQIKSDLHASGSFVSAGI